jgi:hypothetical protein
MRWPHADEPRAQHQRESPSRLGSIVAIIGKGSAFSHQAKRDRNSLKSKWPGATDRVDPGRGYAVRHDSRPVHPTQGPAEACATKGQ